MHYNIYKGKGGNFQRGGPAGDDSWGSGFDSRRAYCICAPVVKWYDISLPFIRLLCSCPFFIYPSWIQSTWEGLCTRSFPLYLASKTWLCTNSNVYWTRGLDVLSNTFRKMWSAASCKIQYNKWYLYCNLQYYEKNICIYKIV